MKNLTKMILAAGGFFVFSEVCGIIGEAQAFAAIHNKYPEAVEDFLDIMGRAKEFGVGPYAAFKNRAVKHSTEVLIKKS